MQNSQQIIFLFIIVFTVLFLLLSSFIIYIVYKYKQRQNEHLQSLLTIEASHKSEVLLAQLEMQEQTFVNISREIHDNVGQKLALAKLQLVTYASVNEAALDDSIQIISTSIADLSDISRTLNADKLLADGLIHAIAFEVRQLEKVAHFAIELKVNGETVFLADNQELFLYRIMQEVLHNILKHADATTVLIDITFTLASITIIVVDDGKGFDTTSISKGLGLQNIQQRVHLLEGQIEIKSNVNQGTHITINIPIHEQNNT